MKRGIFVVLFVIFLVVAHDAFARAGGGGGEKCGWVCVVLAPFFMLYVWVLGKKIARKKEEAAQAHVKAAARDVAWNQDFIRENITSAFYAIQKGWMERDQDLCREWMTDALYRRHKAMTDNMIASGTKNMLMNIILKEVTIVEVTDEPDDSKDSLWAVVEGSMFDYTVRLDTGKVIKGKNDESESFRELWKFKRNVGGEPNWQLDEIVSSVTWRKIDKMRSHAHD